jgi:adenine-specific DNA-methyltransferase
METHMSQQDAAKPQLPQKFDLRSHDIASEKVQELLWLFPGIRTEGGKLDFDRLKLALGDAVDVGRERYGMNWPGKADCFKTIQFPSVATLLPCPKESVDFDATENLIIEGDNLEVLKLLQKSYLGKVRMIYIDPPYNTGNDFIYPDNYAESLQTYLEYTGQVDAEGRRFGTNTDADGRFHSKWLNMIYPRLYLARNLLRDDGVMFISMDDHELSTLISVLNEIFGEENYIAAFAWEKRTTRENRRVFSFNHEYVLCVAKEKTLFEQSRNLLPLTDDVRQRYSNPDNDPRGPWQSVSLNAQAGHATKDQFYSITTPGGRELEAPPGRCWVVTKPRFDELVADNRVWFGESGNNVPRRKVFSTEAKDGLTPHTLWTADEVGTNDSAKKELIALFDGQEVFDTPKPPSLTRRMLEIATDKSDIILDFFAGSGTTAHAVLEQNQQDGGNRKFILVQLPEPTERTDYPTIADVCKERIRRVIKKLKNENAGKLRVERDPRVDCGFRGFKLAESNFTTWDAQVAHNESALEKQLELHIDHVRDKRTDDDILYELLLKSGFPLTTLVEKNMLAGKTVYSIAGGALMICLDKSLTLDLIRAIADRKPERVVLLDEGFAGNDQLKANAVQTFKTKGITSFKTV